jgi:hypothetical protein
MTESFAVSSQRDAHKDVPNSLDTALKYTDGAKLGKNSCLVSVATEGDFAYIPLISGGEIQYGNKRYTLSEATGGLYCFGNAAGEGSFLTLYYPYLTIPDLWDDPTRHQYLMPQAVPVGYYYNFWLFALLGDGNSESYDHEVSIANIYGVLGNTLYFTEREAKSEFTPLTNVLPGNGTATAYNALGNVVPFARITVGVVARGDGPILSFSVSQPMAFGFDTPPRPELRDIPEVGVNIDDNNTLAITDASRNATWAIAHFVEESVDSTTVTLPSASDFGAGYWIRILNLSSYSGSGDGLVIETAGEDVISWPGGTAGNYLWTQQQYSSIRLVSTGTNGWLAIELSGSWMDENDVLFVFDGRVAGGTEDNIVTLDTMGNIKDSGVAIGSIGSGGSPTVSPQTGDYPVVVGDANNTVFVMNSGTAHTFTLEAAPATNRYFTFVNKGAGACTVYGNSKLIGADANVILGTYESITIVYDGTIWLVL